MKLVTGGLIITVAFTVAWTRHRIIQWGSWVRSLEEELLFAKETAADGTIPNMPWESLPPAVQRYLRTALPPRYRSLDDVGGGEDDHHEDGDVAEDRDGSVPTIHSLQFRQEGSFFFGSAWVPFEARQVIRGSSPPGFLWDATISMTDRFRSSKNLQESWWPTMQVCDAWVDGGKQAYMRAALFNVFEAVYAKSTISDEDDDDAGEDQHLWVGQAMRWLAEAFMVPTILLPSRGIVEWSSGSLSPSDEGDGAATPNGSKAVLSLLDPRHGVPNRHVAAVRLEIEFDPDTGYPTRVWGRRPYGREVLDKTDDLFPLFTRKHTSWEWRPWVGDFARYEAQEDAAVYGIVVPTHMEAGWVGENGEVEYYFKSDNVDLQYHVMGTHHKAPLAEAVVMPEVAALA